MYVENSFLLRCTSHGIFFLRARSMITWVRRARPEKSVTLTEPLQQIYHKKEVNWLWLSFRLSKFQSWASASNCKCLSSSGGLRDPISCYSKVQTLFSACVNFSTISFHCVNPIQNWSRSVELTSSGIRVGLQHLLSVVLVIQLDFESPSLER